MMNEFPDWLFDPNDPRTRAIDAEIAAMSPAEREALLEWPADMNVIVADWLDPLLLPRERLHLQLRAEADRTGRCSECRAILVVRDGKLRFPHHALCPANSRRCTHIAKRVLDRHGRVPGSRVIIGEPAVWKPILASFPNGVVLHEEDELT